YVLSLSSHLPYLSLSHSFFFLYFNHPPTTEIYTLSLHDALPISESGMSAMPNPGTGRSRVWCSGSCRRSTCPQWPSRAGRSPARDRKSTRLNSSHVEISYAVFCLKKKKKEK